MDDISFSELNDGGKKRVNRKLIRPNLSDVKGKGRDSTSAKEISEVKDVMREKNDGAQMSPRFSNPVPQSNRFPESAVSASADARKKTPPQPETNAEIYYYKKQIDSHTLMVIVLSDGEEIEGTIEWYDRNALKINRKTAPNLLLLKHNIKYMFKADDRQSNGDS
jgi:sRNA-binding regulator protein Hfq